MYSLVYMVSSRASSLLFLQFAICWTHRSKADDLVPWDWVQQTQLYPGIQTRLVCVVVAIDNLVKAKMVTENQDKTVQFGRVK